MLEFLKKLLAQRKAKLTDLQKRNQESENLDEVRQLGAEITEVTEEIRSLETQIAGLEANETNEENNETEERGFNPNKALNVVANANMNDGQARQEEVEPRGTMEYRTAFKNYIQRGEINKDVLKFETRQDATGTVSNLGILIPTTIIQSIMKEVEKVYGQLYSRVKKTNIPGGVKYPIGAFSATFVRITETTKSDRQNAGGVTGYVEFSYKLGEIRLARTFLQTILSVPAFEEEFAKVIAKAYVKAQDKEIMIGTDANNECVGILTEASKQDSRIPASNIIEFTATEMADWKSWQEKLFAKIPLSMRGLKPEFAMTANTYEANIKTLCDDNNRPVFNETYNPVDGTEIAKFKGKDVVFVEEDILKNFNDALNGEYFGMYWVPEEGYAINSNFEFTVFDYFDHETNQYVKKALVVNDGKVLDPKYIYLLKKKITA